MSTAVTVVRVWTRCYTAAVPRPQRATRRAEIDADLFEHTADLADREGAGLRAAGEILARLVRGVPADLAWTIRPDTTPHETFAKESAMAHRIRTLAIAGWVTAVLLAGFGLWSAVAGLQDGWRELGQHWWSVLAAGGVGVSVLGLAVTLVMHAENRRRA